MCFNFRPILRLDDIKLTKYTNSLIKLAPIAMVPCTIVGNCKSENAK